MREQLELLWQLQAVEEQIRAIVRRRESIKADEVRQLWHEIQLLSQNIIADKEKLECQRRVCAALESDLTKLTRQLRLLEERLYKNSSGSVRELEQLRIKHESLQREIHDREEEVFRFLESCEQLADRIANQETALQDKKQRHGIGQRKIAEAIAALEGEERVLREQQKSLRCRIDPGLLATYQALNAKLAMPVAKVSQGVCSGCRRSIPTCQTRTRPGEIQFCDNCGRILFLK
ncbi:zinc ribbon domain-containing protein [Sporolituus thermophilus]|uniref:Predicted nucleic acid-binding protein, contains Zn-ribbon domain n=1 Tax=Sporolituus thermophilus DSM 23256 TaxID=1123285 RepID=A0A1G7JIJ1_9FIRM|nr:hypothetical protein [Sporolituus thermophilus]SDF24731.1 Predicted nucleic acid-binding protein, contains Zn-ribbon domain [Sporolituus thermophilus DSM 23256]